MRLLRIDTDGGGFSLEEHIGKHVPRYAILSHTWGADHEEVSFKDLTKGTGKSKEGYRKLAFCGKQAAGDGLQYFWVDTCCINKSSSAELSEAINSMFRWYQYAERCYVYLSDVSISSTPEEGCDSSQIWEHAFKKSRWFTRGWTLQELIAPASVEFFSKEGHRFGDKTSLRQTLYETTGITIKALCGTPLSHFSVKERMSWAAKRVTKRDEDKAYCLLGIFNIHLPLIYGEGYQKALDRVWKAIEEDKLPKLSSRTVIIDITGDQSCHQSTFPSAPTNSLDPHEPTSSCEMLCSGLVEIQELYDELQTLRNLNCHHSLKSGIYLRKHMDSNLYRCDWLAKTLGIMAHMVISKRDGGSSCTFYVRWPLKLPFGMGHVIAGRLTVHTLCPALPKMLLLSQNLIPCDSRIISACELGNIAEIREILKARTAHPNDCTLENITVFRYGIRSGKPEVVQLLLEHGADPNLHFGTFETSPLNNAFFIGNADIIRLLMKAGADLEYRNRRSWSSVSYLWEPGRPSHRSTCEILDICAENGFYDWNNTDVMGWSAAHRAAAYGSSDDIRSLAYKGANIHSYTTDQFWGPVTCAVWNSNESTFDALAELLSNEEIVNARDSRGWTLLHFAAQTGSEQLMRKLRVLGVATDALTIPTTLWVTQGLEGKRLTAEVIASEYGYGNSWDKAMMTIDD